MLFCRQHFSTDSSLNKVHTLPLHRFVLLLLMFHFFSITEYNSPSNLYRDLYIDLYDLSSFEAVLLQYTSCPIKSLQSETSVLSHLYGCIHFPALRLNQLRPANTGSLHLLQLMDRLCCSPETQMATHHITSAYSSKCYHSIT